MSCRVLLQTWEIGLKKVSLTKLFRDEGGWPLSLAKYMTDRLLSGRVAHADFCERDAARAFLARARTLGANGKIIEQEN